MTTVRVEVKVGQIWKDNDKRVANRFVVITGISDEVDQAYAICRPCDTEGQLLTKRETRIRLYRFRPTSTGYIIFKQPAGCPPEGTGGRT
jgi:hypothetical protein